MVENEPLILVLYVYDLFLTGSLGLIKDCKRNLEEKFDMKDMGLMHYFIGLAVWQKNGDIFLGKGRHAKNILKRFKMQDYQPMATPMFTNWKNIDALGDKEVDPTLYKELIGSLMYMVNSRSYICFFFNTLCQFMVELERVHWVATRHILRYMHGPIRYGLKCTREDDVGLSRFTDTNWEGSSMDKKSTSKYFFSVGLGIVCWCSRKNKFVSLSLVEGEYMEANTTMCKAIWLRKLLVSFFRKKMGETNVYCDN